MARCYAQFASWESSDECSEDGDSQTAVLSATNQGKRDDSGGWLSNFTTSYTTNKRVVIKSKMLQIPNLIIKGLVVMFILYQLCYKRSFMLKEEVVGIVDATLVKPQKNWDTCAQADVDCISLVGEGDEPDYCNDSRLTNQPFGQAFKLGQEVDRKVLKCWLDEVHTDPGPKIFIPTMVTHIYQRFGKLAPDNKTVVEAETEDDIKKGKWITEEINDYYIQNIEHFLMKMSHGFVSKRHGAQDNVDMSGIVVDKNDQMFKFNRGTDMENRTSRWTWVSDLDPCGGRPGNVTEQPEACAKTLWGDVISVQKLLNLSNTTLDDVRMDVQGRNGKLNVTYRQAGMAIDARISYHNTQDFWNRFWRDLVDHGYCWFLHHLVQNLLDPPTSYTIEFTQRPSSKSFISRTEVRHPFHKGNRDTNFDWSFRALEVRTGIQVDFSAGGNLESAAFSQLLLSAIEAMALLTISSVVVERFLAKVYYWSNNSSWNSVGILFEATKHEETLHESEFEEHLFRKGKHHHSDLHARARVINQFELVNKVMQEDEELGAKAKSPHPVSFFTQRNSRSPSTENLISNPPLT